MVLLLHGYPETARSWAKVQLRLAAAGYRVVALNMRGYAPTSAPAAGDYMVGGLGAGALALIDALGHEQAVVVGHDWGASAALAAVTAAPDKVRGLVTIAIPHPLGIADDPSVLLKASHFVYYQLPGRSSTGSDSNLRDAFCDRVARQSLAHTERERTGPGLSKADFYAPAPS